MRDILFRAKRLYKNEWIEGYLIKGKWYLGEEINAIVPLDVVFYPHCEISNYNDIDPLTVSQCTGIKDKNGIKIFEGDIVQYQNLMGFDIQSVVKFGMYNQDGSNGEYGAIPCLGFYVEADNFTCPDWCDNQPEYFQDHWWYQNILEVAEKCEVIGNIYDNPEIIESEDKE